MEIEQTAVVRPIIMQMGTLDGQAPYETVTSARISQTVIDYPPDGISTTFSLVVDPSVESAIPVLSPGNVNLQPNNNLDAVAANSSISAFLPASALRGVDCPPGSPPNCTQRVQFNVYTSGLFFQQVQSEETGVHMTTDTRVLANSLILGIKVGDRPRTTLTEPVVLLLIPMRGEVSKYDVAEFFCPMSNVI